MKQQPMILLLPELRWGFHTTAKCASSSIENAFMRYYGYKPSTDERERPGCIARVNLDVFKRCCPGFRMAMFVRNPFDRLVSNYEFHIKRTKLRYSFAMVQDGFSPDMSFEQFVRLVTACVGSNPHYQLQSSQYENPDFLGHYETILRDWSDFSAVLGVTLPDLMRLNAGPPRKDYRRYYNDETIGMVTTAYRSDLIKYGYKF